jgi:hypothetical protein
MVDSKFTAENHGKISLFWGKISLNSKPQLSPFSTTCYPPSQLFFADSKVLSSSSLQQQNFLVKQKVVPFVLANQFSISYLATLSMIARKNER